MPYVKVTGYIDVPDEYFLPDHRVLTQDGYEEARCVQVGLLEDLCIEHSDRKEDGEGQ